MWIRTKALQWVMLTVVVGGLSVACGSAGSESSEGSQDGSAGGTTQENSRPSAEGSSNAADTLGNLILLNFSSNPYSVPHTLTLVDTETGQSDPRGFQLPDGGKVNPGGSWRLPFNEDFTKLAIVRDPLYYDNDLTGTSNVGYYRSAGYVVADAGYTEIITSQSSFEGESGYYAATFHNDQLRVMNEDYEWIDPASGDVQATVSPIDETGYIDLYISGSENLTDYGVGECSGFSEYSLGKALPSQVTSGCYTPDSDLGEGGNPTGDIEFSGNDGNKNIEVEGGGCDTLYALDSEDNFYCGEVVSEGNRLVRIDKNTGEKHALTPATDQGILQAIVSSNDEQVLFTARREEDDPITAYAVAAEGGTEPRELSALTGQLSEDQELYSWAAKSGQEPEPSTPETASAEPAEAEPTTETTSAETSPDENPDEEVEAVIRGHYEAIGEGAFEEAYSYFGPSFRGKNDEQSWVAEEESYDIQSSTINSIDIIEAGEDTATAAVDVSFEDNTGEPRFEITWNLIEQGGEWKLDEVVSGEQVE